jgi:asparagine synthase (glutamine-hydrolysing)
MCGIAIHFRTAGAAARLDLARLRHRGPDSSGDWTSPDGRCWLGSTRLAIVDLSPTGAQPMIDTTTGNVIVHNGEIYNHRELRKQLGDNTWQGSSDTETILRGYAQWGRGVVERLKGMFAFVIYDSRRRELFVARDRLGIKPLYYVIDPDGFRFASEVKLLVADGESTTPDRISAYLQWGASPERRLLYPNLLSLPAGHVMSILPDGRHELRRYWPAEKSFGTRAGNARSIRGLLERAIEEHLLSDVPVASFLSGGIDSSIVTALAAQRLGKKLQTFSVGFDEATLDESKMALEVAQRSREQARPSLG